MRFVNEIDLDVFNDAWKTWDKWFRQEYAVDVGLPQFLSKAVRAKPRWIRISDLIQNPPENLAVERLMVDDARDAYPDKPRGSQDLRSIKHHMKSNHVAPIVLARADKTLILLDGMHRLVAARLAGNRLVRAIIIKT